MYINGRMRNTMRIAYVLTVFVSFFSGIVGVEIRHMRVPSVLESGSRPYVILDCDYDLSDSEGHQVN